MEPRGTPGRASVGEIGDSDPRSERTLRLRDYLQSDPTNLELACALIDELLATYRTHDALDVIAHLHTSLTQQPDVRLREARALISERKLKPASDVLHALLQEGLDIPAVRHDLAFAQLCMGDVQGAAQTLDPVLALSDVPVECRVLQSRIFHAQGDLARALEALCGPDAQHHAGALGLRSLLLLDSGDADTAHRCAVTCLALQPNQLEASLVEGSLALWAGELLTASQAFGRVLKQAPSTGRALSGIGQVQMLQGDVAGARRSFDAAVAAMPDHIGTWHALAWACLVGGDVANAAVAFESAYALDRTFGETHGGLALIHVIRNQPAPADAALKRALKLDPHGRTARYASSLLLLERGETDAAAREVEGILEHGAGPAVESVPEFLQQLRQLIQR